MVSKRKLPSSVQHVHGALKFLGTIRRANAIVGWPVIPKLVDIEIEFNGTSKGVGDRSLRSISKDYTKLGIY
jgi:hypothetical protein